MCCLKFQSFSEKFQSFSDNYCKIDKIKINSKCFSWDLKETQTFKAYLAESYKYFIIPQSRLNKNVSYC